MKSHRPRKRLSLTQLTMLVLVAVGLGAGLAYLSFGDKSLPQLTRNVRYRIGLAGAAPPGQWGVYEAVRGESDLDPEQVAEIRRLRSLGYAGGTVPARAGAGVTAHQPDSASRGLRFFTSGHMPGAFLMDPFGRTLHTWRLPYEECIKQSPASAGTFRDDAKGVTACWRRAHLFPGGDVLAIFEGHGLVKIDHDSKVIWSYPGPCHHDLEVARDGTIFVLTRETEIVPDINPDQPVLVDYITHLSAEGELLGAVDLLTAFKGSVYASCLDQLADSGDIFHTNTLEVLDGRAAHLSPLFAEGNFLISLREPGYIAIVDQWTEKVVWAMNGMWSAQHQPTLLENGNILLFDNRGHKGRSKVIEIDPFTQEVVWSFADNPIHPLYSRTCGSCSRLPNGNTLITESDNGRALEVAADGSIVWEFRNPQRTGEEQEFIAAILEMVILPDDFQPGWISAPQ
ncbi:MAG: arylsulfotransferase family protein [Candidatus Krumholzibacteriota bacterium]